MKLGDVATYVNGYAFKPSDYSADGLPIIRIQNLTGNVYETNRFSGTLPEKFKVANGDILISWSASLGVYRWSHGDAWLNQHIFKVVFDKLPVNVDFFVYQAGYLIENSANLAHGATMRHLTKKVFDLRPFYYPSSAIQARIARNLASIDVLLGSLRCQLSTLDDLVKSQFVEMFGDPVGNARGWSVATLGSTCEIVTGNTPSRSDPANYGDYLEWCKTDNITSGKYLTPAVELLSKAGAAKARSVPSGSILMACIAGSINSIGKVAIADRKVSFNQQINAIVPGERLNRDYLYWMLRLSKDYLCTGVNMQLKGILNKSTLSGKEFPLPPLALQQQFADFVARVDKLGFDSCGDAFSACRLLLVKGLAGGVQDGEGPSRRGSVHKDRVLKKQLGKRGEKRDKAI